ncbi:MAG TPA: Gfo/Idh/MocA family oxidoreductase [Rhodothermales bacterium]|nr:Gfo/Idh/MocA family oxidoreductase [Rhodothermales bacterium]
MTSDLGPRTSDLTVGLYGTGRAAEKRAESLERVGQPLGWTGEDVDVLADVPALDVLFVAGPVAERPAAAAAGVQRGAAVFVEWPPAPGLKEAHALVRLGEEAGVEVGVARTLRFHAALDGVPDVLRLVVLTAEAPEPILAGHVLADLVDLAAHLTRAPSLRRLDAQLVRGAVREPRALAAALRFTSGAYAQLSLVPARARRLHLWGVGSGAPFEADFTGTRDDARDRETAAFLAAISERRGAPVSALDALGLMRLLDRVSARVR